MKRLRVSIRGAVQGVGFRPFVHRLASDLGLGGWVLNSHGGVVVEVEGEKDLLDRFLLRIGTEKPALASIQGLEFSFLDPVPYSGFEIRRSEDTGGGSTLVLPDIATCADCLREVFDPADRRHRYPFTNCTHCGPRFSIIQDLPYDRANTTMRRFPMCAPCRAEYEDPGDRRFHAQPTACPECGPRLELRDPTGASLARGEEALLETVRALRQGRIAAVKGLGGFHLMALASDETAVRHLRGRKRREEKPLAVMVPDLDTARSICEVSPLEARVLAAPEAPIVLLARRADRTGPGQRAISDAVAPGNPCLGVLLPYTPLHHLLLAGVGAPVVATSGNLSEEPIATDERDALERLVDIADLFLVHDRPIARHVDDSIVRVLLGRELVLRRARGYAPLPLPLPRHPAPLLAVGGHLKNTVALVIDGNAFVSQHIGDLDNASAHRAFEEVIGSLRRLYRVEPRRIAADMHPDYRSTLFARASGLPTTMVQHHHAHVLSCMADNQLEGPVLGVSWDGTGYGPDGTIWGGEFLLTAGVKCRRFASLRRFRLAGGDRAVGEPRRSALGALYEVLGPGALERGDLAPVASFSDSERRILRTALERGLNAPWTSSAGRLFDAVASLLGLRQRASFEGQAAMELEFAVAGGTATDTYPFELEEPAGVDPAAPAPTRSSVEPAIVVDWRPLLAALLEDLGRGVPRGILAARFHRTLVEIIIQVARLAGEERVVLTGGCFQNRHLTARTVRRLEEEGFRTYWHQRVPPNDGGIALGQALAAAHAVTEEG